MSRVLVINPNSSRSITDAIDLALSPLREQTRTTLDVLGLSGGPAGIQTQQDVESVVAPILTGLRSEIADAYVIACFSDPGLHAARELSKVPVFGIAESGILAALARGTRFGILSILSTSIPRHLRYIGAMGVQARFAGDRAIGVGVTDLADAQHTLYRLYQVGVTLRDTDHADVLIMGCAGMARYRDELARQLGIPVVEPTLAAAADALGAVACGW
ncbi:MAG: aspartate/glutamate racemase family protein [Steroidobacteraceae bacterium]